MPRRCSSWQDTLHIAIAFGSFALAILLSFYLARYLTHSRELLLIAAIVVTYRYGGVMAGLLVALAAFLSFDWFFDSTPHAIDVTIGGIIHAIAFCFLAGLIGFLERRRRQALTRLETTNEQLGAALRDIKTLRGLLTICSYCKKIQSDSGSWIQLEKYVRQHSEAEFTHGICKNCLKEHFGDLYERRYGSNEVQQP